MKISIVIPIHNNEGTISSCLDSFLNQSYEDLEILCIDDHSSDQSFEICQEYMKLYNNVFSFKLKKGMGVSSARNYGLELVSGDVVGFSDADDRAAPGILQDVRRKFESNTESKIIVYAFNRVEATCVRRVGYKKQTEMRIPDLMGRLFYDYKIQGYLWNKYFSREVIDGTRFNQTLTKAEDLNFIFRVLMGNRSVKALVCPQIAYNYYIREESVSHKNKGQVDLGYINSLEELIKDTMGKEKYQRIIRYALYRQALDIKRTQKICGSDKMFIQSILNNNRKFYYQLFFLNGRENAINSIKHCIGKIRPFKRLYRRYRGAIK